MCDTYTHSFEVYEGEEIKGKGGGEKEKGIKNNVKSAV